LTKASAASPAEAVQALVVNAGGSGSRWPTLEQLRAKTAPAKAVRSVGSESLKSDQKTEKTREQEEGKERHEEVQEDAKQKAKEKEKLQIKLPLPAGWSQRPVRRGQARFVWRWDDLVNDKDVSVHPRTTPAVHFGDEDDENGESSDSDGNALTVVEVVRSMCNQDEDAWCQEELTLRHLFTITPELPEPDKEGADSSSFGFWSAFAQEQSTISFVSRFSDSESESEDEEEFLRSLCQDSRCCWLHPLCKSSREAPRVSTAGLPHISTRALTNSPRDPKGSRHGHVSIEAVMTYRFHRGFRDEIVSEGLREQYQSEMCKDPHVPCFCRRCLWKDHPTLKLA